MIPDAEIRRFNVGPRSHSASHPTRSTSLSRDKYEEDEVKNEQNRMKKLETTLETRRLLGDRMISS